MAITLSQRFCSGLAIVMAGCMGWAGIQDYNSLPDFEKNKAQYLVDKRPEAVKAVLQTQFNDFQSQYRNHSFETGALTLALDPNAPATQQAVDRKLESDFKSAVTTKKVMPFVMEPFALAFLAVAAIPFWSERRRRTAQPMRDLEWPAPPPPPRPR